MFRTAKFMALPLAINGCAGEVIKPDECLNLKKMECPAASVMITVADPAFQAHQAYLTNRTNELLRAIPSCSYQSVKEIVFTLNLLTPGAAAEHVCTIIDSSNGNSSRSCVINISTNWFGQEKEPVPVTPGVPHYWEYSLLHEVGHDAWDNVCDRGGFETISFNHDGTRKNLTENDFLLIYSYYPKEVHVSALKEAKEDFAYHFASFVLDRDYFLSGCKQPNTPEEAKKSPSLTAKYFSLQNNIFDREYPTAP
ncbi:MAG: hypothetical protein WCW67_03295 [Candidatus Margulisiibacteriota bacterium]|jgi:hypothetical protein